MPELARKFDFRHAHSLKAMDLSERMRWAPNHNCVILHWQSRYYTCVANAERQSLEQSLAACSQTRRSNIPS